MSDEQTTNGDNGNRATVAQTLAEVRGLRDFIDARFTDTQRQLDQVTKLPEKVASLETALGALDEREQQADADMDRRMTALEQGRSRLANLAGLALISLASGFLGSVVHIIHL